MQIILFLLVVLPAAIKGIFMSTNLFTRACGTLIFLRLVDMLVFGLFSITLASILVWICVGVCYKTSLRRMTNDEIKKRKSELNLQARVLRLEELVEQLMKEREEK